MPNGSNQVSVENAQKLCSYRTIARIKRQPVEEVCGIGGASAVKLAKLRIQTAAPNGTQQLADLDPEDEAFAPDDEDDDEEIDE